MGYISSKKRSLEEFIERNRRFIMPTVLLGGFGVDTLTLQQVDRVFDNVVLLSHLLIVSVCIILLFTKNTAWGARFRIVDKDSIINAIMLFSFGGLFSGFTIFYSKSGSLISSWPFILFMLVVMLGTEIKKNYFQELIRQISIYYIAVFSYLIFSIPVLVSRMGAAIYLLSGVVSLLFIFFFIFVLSRVNRRDLLANKKKILIRIFSIFAIFNILYFLNIIPPIPLSLKFRAVYHDFERVQAVEYKGYYEKAPMLEFWHKRDNVFHRRDGEPVYVYTEVYAPVKLSTEIYHKWEYFDTERTRWVPSTQVLIPITGGRAEGFRGYSQKTNIDPGTWRVKVTTARGQTLGQITFRVKPIEGETLDLRQEAFY